MSSTSLRSRGSVTARGIALLAASSLVLAACGGGADDPKKDDAAASSDGAAAGAAGERDLTLKVGTVLPQTGNLAFLGPPEEAGVMLAAQDINDADAGIKVEVTYGDSGDTDNKAYATTVPQLLNAGVSVIVGAASSGVSKLFLDEVTAAGVLMISPANTSPDFTDWNDQGLYWRTAPSDLLQGEVLGNLVASDGRETVGILYINDAYGTGLEAAFKEAYEAAGGKVVASESYNVGDTTFDAQLSSLTAAAPDAMVLITFDEIKTILPALGQAKVDTSKLYFVDGNIADYSETMKKPSLKGSKGTQPGPALADDFLERMNTAWIDSGKKKLTDLNYAGESYDAVILTALAALAANSTDGKEIASKMQEVSGGSGDGEKATEFKAAAKIITDGGVVDWDGPSGPVTFNDKGDPTEATIGIYEYQEDNSLKRIN